MRKAQKKDILDMIQTLHEAHEEIKNHIDRNNTVSAQDLLAQCQECAVSIGNAIETMEKEDCITIPYIQDYCDLVYQIYEALQNNTDSNANKIYKNLKKQLLRIENSVKNDIPVRKEVAFFPYKASMWDSLESVYLAAKEDPECDAYCVPIPYYDRNPDRSLGQMHYEGNEYPKNIEVIDWQSYNFEERKPDVIYIHNPYDDWNLVTCVHPRYFSSNLKKYTEKLVYIPYFVLQEIEPDDQRTIDNMKHFIWTPGVINADKVIVQSEKMKQIYVNEYLKAAQANGLQGNHLDRKYLEEKFLGLGSPKIDKVLNTKKEDLEIPEEWLKIIQKPDGSWKKIILYNTSIAALLENNERMLEKMKDVFRIFKENKDEVALLWRPHPLIKSTVSSMRPQLWIEYEKLVKWYKEEGWGIYDDTSDMDRAVVISDGYYGDGSSVVQVYQETGKPVMIQNVDLIMDALWKADSNGKRKLMIEDALLINNELWFSAQNFNSLFSIHIDTAKSKFYGEFPNEQYNVERLFVSPQQMSDRIFFSPFFAKTIAYYDMKKKIFGSIEIDEHVLKQAGKGPYFMHARKYHKYLFVFPVFCKVIIQIDTDTLEIRYLSDWYEQASKYCTDDKDAFFRNQSVLLDDMIVIPFCNANAVLMLNCVTLDSKVMEVPIAKNGFSGICNDGKNYWLTPRRGEQLIRWNGDKLFESIHIKTEKQDPETIAFIGASFINDKVELFQAYDETIEIENENINCNPLATSFTREEKDVVIFQTIRNGLLTILSKTQDGEKKLCVTVNDDDIKDEYFIDHIKNKFSENNEWNINQLIGVLLRIKTERGM